MKFAYYGIDPTFIDIHLGHVYCLERIIKVIKEKKINLIILFGTGTCLLGDPSDKDDFRQIKNFNFYFNNLRFIYRIIKTRLEKENFIYKFVFNHVWIDKLKYKDWVLIYGNLSVNKLLSIKYFQTRIKNQNYLPLREFLYFTLQSYDFYYLNKNFNCIGQFGGIDQRNNILMGLKLVKNCWAYFFPLVKNENDKAFSKSICKYLFTKGLYYFYNTMINMNDVIFGVNNKDKKHQIIIKLANLYFKQPKQLRILKHSKLENILGISKKKIKEAIENKTLTFKNFYSYTLIQYKKFQFYFKN